MRIAYIILAHKNPIQIARLVKRLKDDDISFVIHFDKKADGKIFYELKSLLNSIENIYFTTNRIECCWGNYSIVEATLEGLCELFRQKISFDYAILLSGQDFPIKSNVKIKKFLKSNYGKSFMSYFPLPANNIWLNGGLDRIEYWHFRLKNRKFTFPADMKFNNNLFQKLWNISINIFHNKRKYLKGLTPFGGSQWWCITHQLCQYILEQKKCDKRLFNFYKYTFVSDEMIFHTIILNSEFKNTIINDDLRFVDWSTKPAPAILTEKYITVLEKTPHLFARKFDISIDEEILNLVEEKLLCS